MGECYCVECCTSADYDPTEELEAGCGATFIRCFVFAVCIKEQLCPACVDKLNKLFPTPPTEEKPHENE